MDNFFKRRKKGKRKRGCSLLLSAVMVFNMLSFDGITVSAAEEQETVVESVEVSAEGSSTELPETDAKEQAEESLRAEAPETETDDTEEILKSIITESESNMDFQADLTAEQGNTPVLFTFCGVEVKGNASGDGWTYEDKEDEGTLTLDNFDLTDSNVDFMRTNFEKDFTIYLKGDNIIRTNGCFLVRSSLSRLCNNYRGNRSNAFF